MARSYLVPINLNGNEIQNGRIQNLATAPASPGIGQFFLDTSLSPPRLKIWNGAAWTLSVDDAATVGGFTPANLRDRSTHTGTQTTATISDFGTAALEIAQDAVGAIVGAGGLVVTYDDAGTGLTTLTITNNEALQDVIGPFIAAAGGNSGITVTYDDANNRINHVVTDSPTVAGFTPANLRDRSTHTGTQTASTISDFNTAVRTNRIDQLAAAGADVSFGGFKATNLAEPTNPSDAATKNYVDLARQGIRLKDSVRAATTANITLSGTQTVDGVALAVNDRVLVKNQTTTTQNGIYLVQSGAWTRATDADTAAELTDGATVWINEGAQGNTTWAQINTITNLATDAQNWVQQGAAASYVAGAGLLLTGNTFDIQADASGTITVSADAIGVNTAVVARKATAAIGNGSATAIAVTHNFGNQWVTCQVFRNSAPFDLVECDVELTDTNTVTIRFATAPASNAFRAVVTG